ncbi:hypothetical protein [Dictyobacter arantiisoli]|uniref:Uncharacterized protein n=1 Tax=Dictyobacter arantiisoli TaxID=2014874 RepID=A0A5A5TC33_9CHLR|nr:hypothetical protein [Dictyobacter arantiisoli]GCF08706.1 hypothetical protein KDI_22700 [Dictyobacter arantiisoli]
MQSIILVLVVVILVFICTTSYMSYHRESIRRAKEKKRNQFNDRV